MVRRIVLFLIRVFCPWHTSLLHLEFLSSWKFACLTRYVSGWFCENCVNNLFTMNEYSPLNRYAFVAAVLAFNLALSFFVFRG